MTYDEMPGTGESDPASDLVGQVLAGRYRIVAKLGEGAMGAVYLGEHLRMGRRDAIKVLRTGMARDPEAIARFTRGARNVSRIQHANVCTIYDFSDTAEGLQFLAMEFVEGETLKDILDREGRLEVQRAVNIAGQVAAALQAAHDAGIVHRDLKPGNIMLARRADGSDAVKVVDFDIAKGPSEAQGAEVTRLGFVVGTPEYMSPEQLIGERLDGRSDVYSLAIVLFRMLTGTLPFRATTTQEIMVQRLTTEPLRLTDVLPGAALPAALEALLQRSLARKAADRTASAAEFAQALTPATHAVADAKAVERMAELPPTRVVPVIQAGPSGMPRATVRIRSKLRPAVLIGAGALVVLVLVASVLLRGPKANDPGPDSTRLALPQTTPTTLPDLAAQPAADPAVETTIESNRDTAVASLHDPAPVVRATRWADGQLDAMLTRQLETLGGDPARDVLQAVRDSGNLGWAAARTRRDSAAAALVLAQAALVAGDLAGCARWTRRGAALERAGFDMLVQVCK